jgi:RNA polymerase sigma factor (sigma-70 family)
MPSPARGYGACAPRARSGCGPSSGCTPYCCGPHAERPSGDSSSSRWAASSSTTSACRAPTTPRWQCCKLDGYRGASRFTTWAYKFVVLEISVKLHRHAWRGRSIPTADDDPAWDRLAQDAEQAEARLESLDLMRALRTAVAEELTPRQREAFVAVVLNEVPADVLAERLGSTRGAIYKTVHDACRKLFAAVVAGERPAEAAIATLNRFSSQAPAALQLDWPSTGQPRSPSSRPAPIPVPARWPSSPAPVSACSAGRIARGSGSAMPPAACCFSSSSTRGASGAQRPAATAPRQPATTTATADHLEQGFILGA